MAGAALEADAGQANPPEEAVVPSLEFAFNLAKISGHGEDSDPVVYFAGNGALVAVFDGMGGAGGTVYTTEDGPRSGAYLASRIARGVVEDHVLTLLRSSLEWDGAAIATDLHDALAEELGVRLAGLSAQRSALRSTLLRALPTTMAAAALRRTDPSGRRWSCDLWWAGDSRVYVIDPSAGAAQLTDDDLRGGADALANLAEDSVLSNAVSADVDFVVHHRQVELSTPFLLVAATDGCYGYLPTPMHFEHLLLSALRDSPDVAGWSAQVQSHISAVTGDDAALGVVGVGADHVGFKAAAAERARLVGEQWVAPLDELATELDRREQELVRLREQRSVTAQQFWAAYQPGYSTHLHSSSAGRP